MTIINAESVEDRLFQRWIMDHHSLEYYNFAFETVRQADIVGDLVLQFEARYMLCNAAVFNEKYQLLLDAFTWCVSQYDKQPDRFSFYDLNWMYKWTLGNVSEFPGITKEQLLLFLQDFRERLRAAGGSERVYWYYRDVIALGLKDPEFLKADFLRWKEHSRDEFCDCPACEADFHIDAFTFLKEYQSAVDAAQDILCRKMRCVEVPHRTLAGVLEPMLRLGLFEKAHETHISGYRMIYNKPGLADCVFDHIHYLTNVGNLKKATTLFEKHLGNTLEMHGAGLQFGISLTSWLLMERILAKKRKSVRLRLPRKFELFQADGMYDIAQLRDHFRQIAKERGARLDARNGNTFHADMIESLILAKL